MDMLMIFAWIVFLMTILTLVGIVGFLGAWPGKVARSRNHPKADAIAIGGWVTLLAGFVFWPLMLIWAYSAPRTGGRP